MKELEKQIIDKLGFYGMVRIVEVMLESLYPLDLFKDSPDTGAQFTKKLHEAMQILRDNDVI